MATQYFISCKTEEEVKVVYRRLAFKYHPDHGGSNALFQDLQQQYERSMDKIRNPRKAYNPYDDYNFGSDIDDILRRAHERARQAAQEQANRQYDWGREPWGKKRKVKYTWTQKINVKDHRVIKYNLQKFMREPNRNDLQCHIKVHTQKWFETRWKMTVQFSSYDKSFLELISQLVELRDILKD